MPVIQFAKTEQARQIEDFPKECKRSDKGAMHIRPGSTKVVTEGELEHLRKSKVRVAVLAGDPKKADKADKAPQKPADGPSAGMSGAGSSDASTAPSGPSGPTRAVPRAARAAAEADKGGK